MVFQFLGAALTHCAFRPRRVNVSGQRYLDIGNLRSELPVPLNWWFALWVLGFEPLVRVGAFPRSEA